MKKLLAFLISIFLFSSLACQTAADRSEPTRIAVVQTAQPYFATADNWQDIPKACADSLTQVGYSRNDVRYLSSGSVIESEELIWKDGKKYYIYYIITTNHSESGFQTGSQVTISAGFDGRQNFEYKVITSLVLTDSLNRKIDSSIVAIIGETKAITPLNEEPLPISPNNLISGIGLPHNEYYYSIGYPEGSWLPQYTKSKIIDSIKDPIFLYTTLTMQVSDDSPSISANGKSGGPTCNSSGQIVGTVVSSDGNLKEYFVAPLPQNIKEQYASIKAQVKQILELP